MSIKFSIPNAPTKADYNTTAPGDGTIPIINKPALKTVATSGLYNDLTGKPVLAMVATTGKFADLVDEPVLATVATSGAYNDLSGKPVLSDPNYPMFLSTSVGAFPPPLASASDKGYQVTVSSTNAGYPNFYKAFDGSVAGSLTGWVSANTYSGGNHTGGKTTLIGSNTVSGEWLQLKVPSAVVVGSYTLAEGGNPNHKTWQLAGSNDGTTWTLIDSRTLTAAAPNNNPNNYTVSPTPSAYLYFRLVISNIIQTANGFTTDVTELSFNVAGQGRFAADVAVVRDTSTSVLKVSTPAYWRWVFAANLGITANTTTTPPSSAWTLQNPTGSLNVMNANGSITVPATGVYTVVIQAYLGGSVTGAQTLAVLSSDSSLQGIIWLNQAPGTGATWGGSWTGRLSVGTTLTPQFTSGQTSPTLIGASGDARMFTHIGLTQLYTSA